MDFIYILLWLLLLYFLGIRRLTLFVQSFNGGRIIRNSINCYSAGNIKSIMSGFLTSFFLQSPFAASVHAKSYAQSGLFNLKQFSYFISGTHLVVCLLVLLLFIIPGFPTNILIATLIFSVSVKLFFSRFRFWLVDLLIVFSVTMLAMSSVNLYSKDVVDLTFNFNQWHILTAIGLVLGFFFKSQIFCILIACLLFRFFNITSYLANYIIGYQLSFAIWHLFKSRGSNSVVKYGFVLNGVAVVVSSTLLLLMTKSSHLEKLITQLSGIVTNLRVYLSSNLFANSYFEFSSYIPDGVTSTGINIICYNLLFVVMLSVLLIILNLLFGNNLMKSIINKSENKKMQSFKFIENIQFYSPYLFVDHFKKEVKKMAALLQNIISISLDEKSDSEMFLRAKKYSLILERVKNETREYSVNALKRINIPKPNQEFLFYLQISEVIERLSQTSLFLLNIKASNKLNSEQRIFANIVHKNYDQLFESFALENTHVYNQKNKNLKCKTQLGDSLNDLNQGVEEISTILKQLSNRS